MSIAAISVPALSMPVNRTPEAKEAPGPDHDGDGDDKSAGASAPASVPPGMGTAVNTKA